VSPLADLTLVAWALVEVGVRVREGVQGKGRPDRDRATRVLIVMTLGAAIVAPSALDRRRRCCGRQSRCGWQESS
jgi:hypothetical protein